ncbi:MAG: hypothetical protein COA99_03800 [Moraxellaceae bacterium]|nr:MAG: hypothetical protein COA99_03800 [Moraxellaceae bacterium]
MVKEIPGVFHNDPIMSESDLDRIQILKEAESEEYWAESVSGKNRHFMLLDDDEWPSKILAENSPWYRWVDDWNGDNFSVFKSMLLSLDIEREAAIIVFWMKETSIKTTWGVFSDNWANFLYEDEGCIIVIPSSDTSIVLSNDYAWKGLRGTVKA